MGSLGEYVFGVLCAALICGFITRIAGKKGIHGNIIKMLCSIFLMISIVSPLARLSFDSWEDLRLDIQLDAQAAADLGKKEVTQQYRQVITQRTTTYILDKAESLGLTLEVVVTLDEDELAAPKAVTLRGKTSPYAKQVLSAWISKELGIKEQVWISRE